MGTVETQTSEHEPSVSGGSSEGSVVRATERRRESERQRRRSRSREPQPRTPTRRPKSGTPGLPRHHRDSLPDPLPASSPHTGRSASGRRLAKVARTPTPRRGEGDAVSHTSTPRSRRGSTPAAIATVDLQTAIQTQICQLLDHLTTSDGRINASVLTQYVNRTKQHMRRMGLPHSKASKTTGRRASTVSTSKRKHPSIYLQVLAETKKKRRSKGTASASNATASATSTGEGKGSQARSGRSSGSEKRGKRPLPLARAPRINIKLPKAAPKPSKPAAAGGKRPFLP